MTWVSPVDAGDPSFDNKASPYVHDWLARLPARPDPRRTSLALTAGLHAGTDEMIERAFGST